MPVRKARPAAEMVSAVHVVREKQIGRIVVYVAFKCVNVSMASGASGDSATSSASAVPEP